MISITTPRRPRYTYADYMRMQTDWSFKQFKHVQDVTRRRKIRAYEEIGMGVPLYSGYQIVDNKMEILFKDAPNKYLSNFFGTLQANMGNSTGGRTNNQVNTAGSALSSIATNNTSGTVYCLNMLANNQSANNLGSDTATTTVRGNWKPTTALTNNAPTPSVSFTDVNGTFQAVAYNQATQLILALEYATGATSANPTVGEFCVMGYSTYSGASPSTFFITRLAAADTAFTAFTVTSNLGLVINYQQNWPT